MTLHQLVLFVAVGETRKLSEASARFRISQPAVTRQLRVLAEEYGTQLYVAKGRGVELTSDGERFLQHARDILAAVAQLEGDFRQAAALLNAELRIGACFGASSSVIPAVMGDFVKAFPGAKINLAIDGTVVLLQSVLRGDLDLALIINIPREREAVRFEVVSSCRPLLVGASSHSLTRKTRVTARDLRDIPLIVYRDRSLGGKLTALLESAGGTPRVEMECQNAEGVKTAVKAGLGFGLLFEEHISPELRAGLLRPVNLPLLEDVSVPCYAVYSANKPPGPVLGGFIELLRAYGKSGYRCPVTGHPAPDTGNRTPPLPPGTTKGTRV